MPKASSTACQTSLLPCEAWIAAIAAVVAIGEPPLALAGAPPSPAVDSLFALAISLARMSHATLVTLALRGPNVNTQQLPKQILHQPRT